MSIFSRLIFAYLVIAGLLLAVGVYSTIKLDQLNRGTREIIGIDNRILDSSKKLTESMLSQVRYAKKHALTKDPTLYQQFLSARDDFDKTFGVVLSIADTAEKMGALGTARTYQLRYQSLVDLEDHLLKVNQSYDRTWFEAEKGKMLDGILEELEKLEGYARRDIQSRMNRLEEAAVSSRKLAAALFIAALLFAVGTSLLITRSITKPLSLLMKKTEEISQGVFKGDLNISSPPEISALANALNVTCNKLKVVDRMKSDFFSMMSHELRTPLTSIKEGTSLLLEGKSGTVERQKKLLGILEEESGRLIRLVNALLDLSKMEAGMMTYSFEQRSLAPLIQKAMTEIGPLIESKKISLEARISEGLPLVRMDSERILQTLRNLIGNAVKFTPDGGHVRISARAIPGGLEVSVADTGPGIPPDHLETIFEKYQQASPTGSYRINGTGLGLAVAKHIISSHGGRIWAESETKQGSTFFFVLPA